MGSSGLTLKPSRMYHQDVFGDPMLSSKSTRGHGSQQLSATWGNLRREVSKNALSSNDPFVENLDPDPMIKFLPTKHVQKIQNLTEIVKGGCVQVDVEGATTELTGFGLVHTNPEMFKNTIISSEAPPIETEGTLQNAVGPAFEAGPTDKIKWRCFNLPKYGQVLGFTAPSKMTPWIKFKTLSTDKINGGNLAANKIWELIGIPCDPPSDPDQVTLDITETQEKAILKRKIQVVSVLRPAKRLKFQKTADDEKGVIVVEGQKFTDVSPAITKRIMGLVKTHGKQDGIKN